jgi:hypothetical protein
MAPSKLLKWHQMQAQMVIVQCSSSAVAVAGSWLLLLPALSLSITHAAVNTLLPAAASLFLPLHQL